MALPLHFAEINAAEINAQPIDGIEIFAVTDTQSAYWDVTNSVTDTQAIYWDVTSKAGGALCLSWDITLAPVDIGVTLSITAANGTLSNISGSDTLSQKGHCEGYY